ncbi:MAG: hypothetical protein IKS71_00350, partial [Bacteroidales bacterium]|nr:hypothetical protein [Bacteroidales bacterium]
MKLKGTVLIIHAFALAHALTAAICAWTNIPDSLLLTLLTMVMTVLLCSRKRISLQLATVTIILVNILGVVLGNTGASLLSLLPLGHAVLHSISTFITTELLGWGLVLVFRMIPHRPNDDRRTLWWERGTGWMIMVVAVVFVFRLAISVMLSTGLYGSSGLWPVFSEFLSNPLLLLLMLCANIIFLRAFKFNARQNPRTYLIVVVFVLLNAAAADLFLCFGLPQTFSTRITWEAFA